MDVIVGDGYGPERIFRPEVKGQTGEWIQTARVFGGVNVKRKMMAQDRSFGVPGHFPVKFTDQPVVQPLLESVMNPLDYGVVQSGRAE